MRNASKKTPRKFRRDAYVGFRLPEEHKCRLENICRLKCRDMSSYAIEFVVEGITKVENELKKQPLTV